MALGVGDERLRRDGRLGAVAPDPRRELGQPHLGVELDAPDACAEPVRLRARVVARQLDRARRDAGRVFVPLEGRKAAGEGREDSVVSRRVGELDREPADLGLRRALDAASRRAREELCSEADSERRCAFVEDALEVRELRHEPRVRLILVRVRRPAEHEHGSVLARLPLRQLAAVKVHLDHAVAAGLDHVAEERGSSAVAVHEREDIHVPNVYIRAL
jgi:hypothetical protein